MPVGLDIGTANLVAARQDGGGQINLNSVRDSFLEIEADPSTINMLKMSNTSYIQEGDKVYIIGENSISISNLLKTNARRPLSGGIISPGELDAEKILVYLIKGILKEPMVENEIVYYSVPAKPIDKDIDILYHSELLKRIINNMGYNAKSLNEAAALVYSNCSNSGFTALSSSFGAGMVNTALVFQTMVGMAFSTSKSGDYIDSSAAKAVGSTATRLMSIKEKGVDLLNPSEGDPKTFREREAIIIYYRNLIHNVIDGVKKEFKKDNSNIELPDSIPWILSGGTVKPKHFLEFFKSEFEKERKNMPFEVSDIKIVNDPLNDVAKGLLIAAMNE